MQALDLQPASAKFDKAVRKEFAQFKAEVQKTRGHGCVPGFRLHLCISITDLGLVFVNHIEDVVSLPHALQHTSCSGSQHA